ncbi:MAG TPA: flavodoxin family protein [Lachnospiraceae bacterium]|nr:flavodoxin family protein [Lachnospiraceae bacterium]
MKVLLINGSPHVNGCTYTALHAVASSLHEEGIETELFHIGTQPISGCIACGKCKDNQCILPGETVNFALSKAAEADGIIVGSPVYYASPNGSLISLLDRMFYAGNCLSYKPAAAIASARRAGTTAALDVINKYFLMNNMPLVSSQYWNMVHGSCPEDVLKDLEGLQIMKTLGKNMAWLLKSINAGKSSGIIQPTLDAKIHTNFIR